MLIWGNMTEEAKRDFVREWATAGKSSADMGMAVQASRNTIIGFARRRKIPLATALPRRGEVGQRVPRPRPVHQTKPQRDPRAFGRQHSTKVGVDFDRALRLPAPAPAGTILSLRKGVCHFPMFSDQELKDTLRPSELPYCCAAVADVEHTYCEYHQGVMYRRLQSVSEEA